MNTPDYPLYKLDLSGTSQFNKINKEEGIRENTEEGEDFIFIPLQAPFYIDSVEMFNEYGTPLKYEEDYDFYGILSSLTAYTAKPVGLYIRILKPTITKWFCSYQVVGNFNKITDEILMMLKGIGTDKRAVYYDDIKNKPLWFYPELHNHDLAFQIFGFGDLAREILRVTGPDAVFGKNLTLRIDQVKERIIAYIGEYQKVLKDIVDSHDGNLYNAHGVNNVDLGLGNVDNFATATLQETLDGIRTDLHMVPVYVAQAVSLATGRNERLLPSGSLPLLRYGQDTFIPPKIDGSFEGQGGWNLRFGVNIEPNLEALILQRRYNGKVKGLYFLRSTDWSEPNPTWEYTGYRYTHPTATADTANLNAIIGGSNQYIMIIGDEDKGIWYWVETNGSFNPSQHVLKRITNTGFLSRAIRHWEMHVIADANYKEFTGVVCSLDYVETNKIRPFPAQGGTQDIVGKLIFMNYQLNGQYASTLVNYTSVIPGVPGGQSGVFVPAESRIAGGLITAAEFNSTVPITELSRIGSTAATIAKNPDGSWALSLEYRAKVKSQDNREVTLNVFWRGNFTINFASNLLTITNGFNEKVYTINPFALDDVTSDPKFKSYKYDKFKGMSWPLSGTAVAKGHRFVVTTTNRQTVPLKLSLEKDDQYSNPKMISGELDPSLGSQLSSIFVPEASPLGLNAGFMNPFICVSDSVDWSSGIMMARQFDPIAKKSKWVARKHPFLNSNWTEQVLGLVTTTIGGTSTTHNPMVNVGYETNLGTALCMTATMQTATTDRRLSFSEVFGADAFSWILGRIPEDATQETPGDQQLVLKNTVSVVNNVVTFKPTLVVKLDTAITRDLLPTIKQLVSPDPVDISKSWTVIKGWNTANTPVYYFIASWMDNGAGVLGNVMYTIFPIGIATSGNKTTIDGTDYYDDAKLTFIRTPRPAVVLHSDVIRSILPKGCGNDPDAHSALTMQYARFYDTYGLVFSMRTLHRWTKASGEVMGDILFEAANNLIVNNLVFLPQVTRGPETDLVQIPLMGYGVIGDNAKLSEGAAVIAKGIDALGGTSPFVAIRDRKVEATRTLLGMNNMLFSAYMVYFNEIENVILAGKPYNIPATFFNIKDFDSTPANKRYYIYLKYDNTGPKYEFSIAIQSESSVCSLIAIVQCGPTQIDSITPFNRFSMDGTVISTTRQGGSILSTPGSVFELGATPWFGPSDYV